MAASLDSSARKCASFRTEAAEEKSVLTYITAPDKIDNYYAAIKDVGQGGFAVVRKCRRVCRPILHNIVLKTIKKEKRFMSCVLRPDKEKYQAALLPLNHPNVASYYDFLEDDLYAYVVMPRYTGPSLWVHLQGMSSINEFAAQDIMVQILRALDYIHSVGITHRDVTPNNFMYETPESSTLKLIDFGLCALDANPNEAGSVIGTTLFIAPEVYSGRYSEAIDVWSAGVMMYMVLSGRFPFLGATAQDVLMAIEGGVDMGLQPWPQVSVPGQQLVCSMLTISDLERPKAADLLKHDWFSVPRLIRKASGPRVHIAADLEQMANETVRLGAKSESKASFGRSSTLPAARSSISDEHQDDFNKDLVAPLLERIRSPKNIDRAPLPSISESTSNPCSTAINQGRLLTTGVVCIATPTSATPMTVLTTVVQVLGGTTEWDGTVATFSLNIGAALLATPFTFTQVGLAAIPLLMFLTACSCYTAHIMAWALESQKSNANRLGLSPEGRDWCFLVDAAFGTTAKRALTGMLIIELWGYVISYTVVAAVHIHLLFSQVSQQQGVLISTLATFVLCFASPQLLTRVNVACNGVFFLLCGMFVITGFMLPESAPESDFFLIDTSKIMASCGILVFNSASHACYPTIMQSMREPERYTSSVKQSYCAQLMFYLCVCVPAYFCFGDSIQQTLVGNIGRDRQLQPIPGLGWMGPLAAAGMVLKMTAMQPLVFTPLVQTIGGLIPRAPKSLLGPGVLCFSAACSAIFADEMATLINLIGSVLCMNIAFVMPTACYWQLAGESSSLFEKSRYAGLIFMGAVFAVLGLLSAAGIDL